MKYIAVTFYVLIGFIGIYGLLTRDDTSWRSAVPYLALVLAASARGTQEMDG